MLVPTPLESLVRRQLLLALGAGVAAPLVGCGGGSGSNASSSASTTSTSTTEPMIPSTPSDMTPSVTFDAVAMSALAIQNAYLTDSAVLNPVFSFYGAGNPAVTQFGPAAPRQTMASSVAAKSDTLLLGSFYATFYHTGATLDIIQYGISDNVTVYINDTFMARYGLAFAAGIALGGSADTITLASTSSTVSGYYNEYYVRITGGTGVLDEVRQVTAYDGATGVTTVASAWTTAPDSTTQYILQEGTQAFVLDGTTGLIKYLHFKWPNSAQRKITVEQGVFAGVAADGIIAPAPAASSTPLLVVGDSFWDGFAAPINVPRLIDTFALSMDWLPTNLGEGGTGYTAVSNYNRLSFQDRISPPAESWRVLCTATGGTFSVSLTYGGRTDTAGPFVSDESLMTMQTALNALQNVNQAGGYFFLARGDLSTPLIVVGHGITGAAISFDGSALTGGGISVLGRYLGDVTSNLPIDGAGNALPFYLMVPGSVNDDAQSDATIQAAATFVAQQIVAKYPTATTIFTGVFGDCAADESTISESDLSRNAAIAAAAAYLPKINGKAPFIDTYQAGLGGLKIINGLGTVADPQPGTNSNLKSATDAGHPTGPGSEFLSDWLTTQVKALLA